MKKQCSKCKQLKSLGEFHKSKSTKDGLRYYCKECMKEYHRMHKIEISESGKKYNKTEKGKLKHREQFLKNYYNMTLKQYDQMLKEQNDVCAICGGINIDGRRLYVDHNHETGEIRALLCNHCNSLIGQAKENIVILQSAINYLKRHET